MSRKEHWESVYESKDDNQVSWTQPDPRTSLDLIGAACGSGRVIDVGGGASVLALRLLDAGYSVAVLDISAAALMRAQARLAARASNVQWIVADVTACPDIGHFDVWHDRALFHFLTNRADRAAYVTLLSKTVRVGGHVVVATFAPDGHEQCSGLPVQRYDARSLAAELGPGLEVLQCIPEMHVTPSGKPQSFQYSLFRRW